MGIKTEDMYSAIPPKEITAGVDWMKILDDFDPSELDQKYIDECARRNPYETCYKWDVPRRPVEDRINELRSCASFYRKDLKRWADRIENEGLTSSLYNNTRRELIRNVGMKGAMEYLRREYDRLGEVGRKIQRDEYEAWDREWQERNAFEQEFEWAVRNEDYGSSDFAGASVHEKVIRIRKGLKASNGKPLTQRDFAKFLDYPIYKYAEAERIDRYGRDTDPESEVETELLDKLVMIAHANPYWLFDPECEAYYAEDDPAANAVVMGDEPCVYATVDVILRWIKEGKPRDTNWVDGVGGCEHYDKE